MPRTRAQRGMADPPGPDQPVAEPPLGVASSVGAIHVQGGRAQPAGPVQAEAEPPLGVAARGGARRRTPREAPPADIDIGVNKQCITYQNNFVFYRRKIVLCIWFPDAMGFGMRRKDSPGLQTSAWSL